MTALALTEGSTMVIVLALAAWIGGLITVVALWPFGWLIAFAGAPFGGSLLALAAAVLVVLRDTYPAKIRSRRSPATSEQMIVRTRSSGS